MVDWLRQEWEELSGAVGVAIATAGSEGEVSMSNSSASTLLWLEITKLVEPHAEKYKIKRTVFGEH